MLCRNFMKRFSQCGIVVWYYSLLKQNNMNTNAAYGFDSMPKKFYHLIVSLLFQSTLLKACALHLKVVWSSYFWFNFHLILCFLNDKMLRYYQAYNNITFSLEFIHSVWWYVYTIKIWLNSNSIKIRFNNDFHTNHSVAIIFFNFITPRLWKFWLIIFHSSTLFISSSSIQSLYLKLYSKCLEISTIYLMQIKSSFVRTISSLKFSILLFCQNNFQTTIITPGSELHFFISNLFYPYKEKYICTIF